MLWPVTLAILASAAAWPAPRPKPKLGGKFLPIDLLSQCPNLPPRQSPPISSEDVYVPLKLAIDLRLTSADLMTSR